MVDQLTADEIAMEERLSRLSKKKEQEDNDGVIQMVISIDEPRKHPEHASIIWNANVEEGGSIDQYGNPDADIFFMELNMRDFLKKYDPYGTDESRQRVLDAFQTVRMLLKHGVHENGDDTAICGINAFVAAVFSYARTAQPVPYTTVGNDGEDGNE